MHKIMTGLTITQTKQHRTYLFILSTICWNMLPNSKLVNIRLQNKLYNAKITHT